MRRQAVHHRFDQRRSFAGNRALARFLHDPVHFQRIVAIHPNTREIRSRAPGRQSSPATCLCSGTEIAYWLFSHMKITGSLCTPAKLQPSWKSPWLLEPSPKVRSVTKSFFFIFAASAKPTACGTCVVTGLEPVRCAAASIRNGPAFAGRRCSDPPLLQRPTASIREASCRRTARMHNRGNRARNSRSHGQAQKQHRPAPLPGRCRIRES